jgi:hypothetical protein
MKEDKMLEWLKEGLQMNGASQQCVFILLIPTSNFAKRTF